MRSTWGVVYMPMLCRGTLSTVMLSYMYKYFHGNGRAAKMEKLRTLMYNMRWTGKGEGGLGRGKVD